MGSYGAAPTSLGDLRISIYSPTMKELLVADASADLNGGQVQYEDTPAGCGAGSLTLGITLQAAYAKGYWAGLNFVEISTGDDVLQANAPLLSSGSQRYFVQSAALYDPVLGEDDQQVYFWDNTNLTMRCPVSGIGFQSAPNIVNQSTRSATGTSLSVPITTPTAGHQLLAIVSLGAGITPSIAGWTLVGSGQNGVGLYVFKKTAAGTETAVAISAGSSTTINATILEAPYVGAVAATFDITQNGPLLGSPFVTSPGIGSLCIGAFAIASATTPATPRGWTLQGSEGGVNGQAVYSAPYSDAASQLSALVSWGTTTTPAAVCVTITLSVASGLTPAPYINVGMPLGGGAIPAYAAGTTTIGRRRYMGRVWRRNQVSDKIPNGTITLMGVANDLNFVQCNATINTSTNTDIGAAIEAMVSQFAYRWQDPSTLAYWLTINSNQTYFPYVGSIYGNQKTNVSVGQVVADMISQISTGDLWVLRVGHDRTPRLIRLNDFASGTYTYSVTLQQGTWAFEPTQVTLGAEDCSGLYNAVLVTGDTDSVTNQTFEAISVDSPSISFFGGVQIDGPPVNNLGCKSIAACATYGASLLSQFALPRSNNSFVVYGRNDKVPVDYTPAGQQGDVVRAVQNITLTNLPSPQPNVSGIGLSVVTTIDLAKLDRYQQVKFAAIAPSMSQAIQERTNALANALATNTKTGAGVDQYFCSALIQNLTTSGLVISFPAFKAVFALGSFPVSYNASTATMTANAYNYVWLNPTGGQWTVTTSPSQVAGSILVLVAHTNATKIMGYFFRCAIGLLDIPAQYFYEGALVKPNVVGPTGSGVPTFTVVKGQYTSQMQVSFELTNQPTDGSLAKIICWYRQQGQPTPLMLATSPPRDATQISASTSAAITTTGTQFVPTNNQANMYVGAMVAIGGAHPENVTITNVTGTGFYADFLYTHLSGVSVSTVDGNGKPLTGGATSATGLYTFLLPEAANGTTFEFLVSVESIRGTESATTSLGTQAADMSVPAGFNATDVSLSSTYTIASISPTAPYVYSVTLAFTWAVSGTDFSWIDHLQVVCGYVDPGIGSGGALPLVAQIPIGQANNVGSGSFDLTLSFPQNNGSGTTPYAYSAAINVVAVDGSILRGSVIGVFSHA